MTWPGMRCSGGKNILDALSYRSGIWQSTVKEQNDVGEILYPGVDPVVKGSGQRVNFFGKMLSPRGGANFGDWNICERKQIAAKVPNPGHPSAGKDLPDVAKGT